MLEAIMLATLMAATPSAKPASTAHGSFTVGVEIVESCRFDTDDGKFELVCNGRVPHYVQGGKIVMESPSQQRVEGNQILVVF